MTYNLYHNINKINTTLRNKKFIVRLKSCKKLIALLQVLSSEGLLIVRDQNGELEVEFKKVQSSSEPVLRNLVCLSTPSRKVSLGWRSIRNYKQGSSFTLIETNVGLLRDQEAIRLRTGGFLFIEVNI